MLFGLVTAAVGAVLVAAVASRLRISSWWFALAGAVAAAVALTMSSRLSSCSGSDTEEAVFSIAVLTGATLFATFSFTALFELRNRRAAGCLLRFLLGAGLCVGTLFMGLVALLACLE